MSMRKLAKILTIAALSLLVLLAILSMGVLLRVDSVRFVPQSARANPALTQELIGAARRDDMLSNRFRIPTRDGLDSYQLISIKIDVRNVGLWPAEWVQLRLSPDPMDIALFPGGEVDVFGFGTAQQIDAMLLCEAEAPASPRPMWLDYYVFGRKFEIPISVNP